MPSRSLLLAGSETGLAIQSSKGVGEESPDPIVFLSGLLPGTDGNLGPIMPPLSESRRCKSARVSHLKGLLPHGAGRIDHGKFELSTSLNTHGRLAALHLPLGTSK